MKREYFKQIMYEFKAASKLALKLENMIGINLYESNFPIMNHLEDLFETVLESHFKQDQLIIIYEYIFENDWCETTDVSKFISLAGLDLEGEIGNLDDLYDILQLL